MLTVTKVEKCPKCGSTHIVKNGFTRHGNQQIKCKDCKKSPVLHPKKQHPYETACLVGSFLEPLRLLGVRRVFALNHYQVYHQLNIRCLNLPDFKTQIVDCKTDKDVLEFDELCGFCGKKANKQWVWATLCKATRQIVGYLIGYRSEATFKRLLRKIPADYLQLKSYSHYWKSYTILCSKGNHRQAGKGSGKTIT